MYGYNNHHHQQHHMENTSSSNSYNFYNHFPITTTSSHTTILPSPLVSNLPPPLPLSINNIHHHHDQFESLKSEFGGYNSSGSSSYGSPNNNNNNNNDPTSLIQRSISSQSLVKNMEGFFPLVSSPTAFLDSETASSSVRKVLSAGDLQVMHVMQYNYRSESPLSSESNSIIEGMNKACKYSPEEKKERIERYRSKRNQRNFNKKIKYECRKTLADSRPRIRGRFARNDERNPQNEYWNQSRLEELGEEDDENWIGFLDAFIP